MADKTETCEVGFARMNITPKLPCRLAGYPHVRVAERVDDDLFCRVMAIRSGGETVVFGVCDLIAMTEEIAEPVRARVADECGVDPDRIILSATHTHTAPEVRHSIVPVEGDYVTWVTERIAEALSEALSSMFEATLRVGRSEARGVAYNRLFRQTDGNEVFGLGQASAKELGAAAQATARVIGPAGDVDPTVLTLAAYDAEKRLKGAMVNFACHPDIIGGATADFVSADWPGVMCDTLEAAYGDDTVFVLLQGASGDINHNSNREEFVPNGGPLRAAMVGRTVAGGAMQAIESNSRTIAPKLAAAARMIEVPYLTRTEEDFARARETRERMDKGEELHWTTTRFPERVENWEFDNQAEPVRIQAVRLGDAAFVAMPGEIFTALGMEVRRYSPSGDTFFIELASAVNGMTGYKAPMQQADRNAYGQQPFVSRRHVVEAGNLMANAAIELVQGVWE